MLDIFGLGDLKYGYKRSKRTSDKLIEALPAKTEITRLKKENTLLKKKLAKKRKK